jgi:hypothetical protein
MYRTVIETFNVPSTALLNGVGKERITNRIADAIKLLTLVLVLLALNSRKNLWREFNWRKVGKKVISKLGSKRYKHQEGSESNQ